VDKDEELVFLIAAWPTLPEAIKSAIVALVKATKQ